MPRRRPVVRRIRRRTVQPLELPPRAVVKCAFCRGTGRDPFGLLSNLSDCQVCLGRGEVRIAEPVVECAFCQGSGIQPYTTSCLHCLACGGKGSVTAVDPSKECPTCEGSGVYPRRPHPVHCPTCRGQGKVLKRET